MILGNTSKDIAISEYKPYSKVRREQRMEDLAYNKLCKTEKNRPISDSVPYYKIIHPLSTEYNRELRHQNKMYGLDAIWGFKRVIYDIKEYVKMHYAIYGRWR